MPISLFFTIILHIVHLTQRERWKGTGDPATFVGGSIPSFLYIPTRRKGKVVQVQVKMLLMMMNVPNIYIRLHFLILDHHHHRLVIKLRGQWILSFTSRISLVSFPWHGWWQVFVQLVQISVSSQLPNIYNFGSQAVVVEERLYFSPSIFFLCYCSCSSVRTKDI